jgi:stage II sporulation protein AA (anti-sigma F factor antagonist)
MDETTTPGRQPGEPQVAHVMDGDTARLTLAGELTDAARRPLVRILTDLLLSHQALQRLELVLDRVTFMNSAGMSVLVQAQRMTSPRGVEVVLVDPPPEVIRPLQLSGLWHRFPVLESAPGERGDADS